VIALEPVKTFSAAQAAGAPYSCSRAWLELCRGLYRYDTRLFLIKRGGAAIGGFCCAVVRSGLFRTRLISMPFSDEPGFWLAPGSTLSAQERAALNSALAATLDALARETRAAYAELRGGVPAPNDAAFSPSSPYLRPVLYTSPGYEALRGNFHVNLIKNLRKADKTVTVAETRSPADFRRVYGIYLRQMRLFGSPPLPAAHFERLLEAGLGRLFIASVGKAQAALLFALVWDGVFYADVNAGLPAYSEFFPKIRLFDATIRLACAEGLRAYDFMRTRPGSGVHEHKKKWGGSELPIDYFFRLYDKAARPGLDPGESRFALPRLLLKNSPLPLLGALGPVIRRHAGK
jgi:hypothetical protein